MDAAEAVQLLAVEVGEMHLEARRYIAAGPGRNPFQLPEELQRIRGLMDDLQRQAHRLVPQNVYAHHLQNTRDIETQLLAIENGFARRLQPLRRGEGEEEQEEIEDQNEGEEEWEVDNGGRMRRDDIPEDELRELLDMEYTDVKIAEIYGCHPRTVARRLRDLRIWRRALLNSTTDEALAEHIQRWWQTADENRSGAIMAWGWLKSEGIPCTREQVRRVINQLQPEAVAARTRRTIARRDYHVPFPNDLWHIDGHHKLSDWKMVIHGGIDGYSHAITFLGASDNNRACTVRRLFLDATMVWGWPQRVRADHGGENVEVGADMELHRGEERGSFITGPSTHNQRIERLWRDVRNAVVDKFADAFRELEAMGALNRHDASHLFCLHYVYLPLLQEALNVLVRSWNHHHMASRGTRGESPRKQWHSGLLYAQRNGFAFDHYPNPEEEEDEERDFYAEMAANGYQVGDYNPDAHRQPVRLPRPHDPHVQVPRFGDYLPEFLYSADFQQQLVHSYPPGRFESAQEQYINMFTAVDECIREHEAGAGNEV